jgi:SEC-C motif-containing protein
MSAEARSSRGFVVVRDEQPCPCGSGGRFDECCGPLLRGEPAPTAEKLMRSRYTAFVVGDARYLAETWHPGTRPRRLDLDPSLRWAGLEVTEVVGGTESDTRGVVGFRAGWRDGRETGILAERSRFVRQSDRWWYLDGEVS